VIAVPGRGYSLVEGYFLPPLRFSADEAIMLVLGCEMIAQQVDAEYRAAAQSAGRKIAGALPEERRADVRQLQRSIRFVSSARLSGDEAAKLLLLRGAIIKQQTVRMRYHGRHAAGERPTPRDVDPYGLAHASGAWHLAGYCHLRQSVRHFRVSRMDDLTVLPQRFTRPADFTIQQRPDERRALIVRALFAPEVARWVRESPSFYMIAQEQTADGLLVTLQVRAEQDVLQWLLSWGRHVRVLEPATLRRRLADEAAAMLATFQSDALPAEV
jgi:predicted DNA-binding transcriptional regulator YafY